MIKIGGIREQWILYDDKVLRRYPDYSPKMSEHVSRGFIGGAMAMLRFFTERLPKDRIGQEKAIREMREELQMWGLEFEIKQ